MQGISCNQCGKCCKVIRMFKDVEKPPFFKEIPKEKAFEVFPIYEVQETLDKEDIGYYECDMLTEDNKCGIQSLKPDLCKVYPHLKELNGKKIEFIIHPACAFYNNDDKYNNMVKRVDDLFHNNKEQYEEFIEKIKEV